MIVLVIPCYNERNRLDLQAFVRFKEFPVKFLFVDDGSRDGTAEFIETAIKDVEHCRILRNGRNQGKAGAVRDGMLSLVGNPWVADCEWAGFWDADLATPLSEIKSFFEYKKLYPICDSLWGSRIYRLGSQIERSVLRHYLGRGFATVIHKLLKVESYDTQCGAKLFRMNLLTQAFSEPFISRWIFDVEILLRLKNKVVVEYPLMVWKDVPGSKVKVFREIFRVFKDILEIRKKYKIGSGGKFAL